MKITILLLSCLLNYNLAPINDSIYCEEIKIKCEKNNKIFENCLSKDPLNVIINTFGKPDSVIQIDVIGGGSVLYYTKNSFSYIEYEHDENIYIKDKSFSILIDDTLNLMVGDPINKLNKRFPMIVKTYLANSNHDLLSIPFGSKSSDLMLTKNTYLDFIIRNYIISQILITFYE
jgi:hypothetical protein